MDIFSHIDLFSTDEVKKTSFDLPGADITFYENFFSASESDRLYKILLAHTEWQQDYMTIYGKELDLPRLTAWYGDTAKTLTYAGSAKKVHPWNSELLFIKERVEQEVDIKFTRCLLNLYRDGKDSVDWHQDYQGELRENTVIGSVTFGETRPFQLKHATRKDLKRLDIPLSHGSLLLMQGATQQNWKHRIPKTTKNIQPRINLTFRWVE